MADRKVHYEAAFEAMLRERGVPCVAVDEAKRAVFANAKLKSFDFVVYSQKGSNLLVDVKGRQHRGNGSGSSFQTWATKQDVDDLVQWEQVFGEGFKAVFMFVYWIDPPLVQEPGMYEYEGRWYVILGVELQEYRQYMRQRSAKWETVALPIAEFRSLARPIEDWL
ncbi:MAG TPA: HYExAFE family protein [Tepidisphaeraceae bacterium]|nr:HYExAFE family protein [Tepidisphaeraceae bacterium]